MLVLSRKLGESIRIGDDIEIIVSHISNNRVKLSIAAPRNIVIRRTEIAVKVSPDCQPGMFDCESDPHSRIPLATA